jgi:MOSC domain-containing protein YiiM
MTTPPTVSDTLASLTLTSLFAGGLRPLPPEGQLTGMFKVPVEGRCTLGPTGLAGDRQADPRYHGGPQKALHHYPAEHYERLAALRPALAGLLTPGVLGENISTHGWTEHEVCIGDIIRLGTARIQVSEPRSPCWKIDARCGDDGLSRLIAAEGLTGWYYRVLTPGSVAAGDALELEARPSPGLTLARLWRARIDHRPDLAELAALAAASGLSPAWQKRLADRHAWLLNNA